MTHSALYKKNLCVNDFTRLVGNLKLWDSVIMTWVSANGLKNKKLNSSIGRQNFIIF